MSEHTVISVRGVGKDQIVSVDRLPLRKTLPGQLWLSLKRKTASAPLWLKALPICRRYRDFTMVPLRNFHANLVLCAALAPPRGLIVECGVWRGGMSAGMADMLPGRTHYLFDSFEGLPPATAVDGDAAIRWQADKTGAFNFDNCRVERSFAERAMSMSAARDFNLVAGWFKDTVVAFAPPEPIAVLRLDGDWYDSTMQCLNALYPHVAPGGIIILDDYYTWDGCARAVHDYLSSHKLTDRIEQTVGLAYFVKRSSTTSNEPLWTSSEHV